MSVSGLPDHRLEEIELRLVGADFRPWIMSGYDRLDPEGRQMVMKGSRRQVKKAIRKANKEALRRIAEGDYPEEVAPDPKAAAAAFAGDEPLYDSRVMVEEITLFMRTDSATDEMLEFIVHAPEDVEDLLREVQTLRVMFREQKEKYDQAVQDLQRYKIDASRAEEKIVDMRRAWRTLVKEMGGKS